ncbi:MAG: NAD(P)H-dependent flavin oxidoreductase [bacterium]
MKIETPFTKTIGIDLPIVVAPMFLVSNVEMVVKGSEAGALGTFPALNVRPVEKLREWLQEIKKRTPKPYAVNLIVNRTNIYFKKQMEICLEENVPMIIASLGDPSELIEKAHEVGTKVFCDVIHRKHAQKAADAGADGLIAVSGGAGGHAGNISSLVWIPYLRKHFDLPILAAGNIATGEGMAAALALGASGVYLGTRFLASTECPVSGKYKQAIVNAQPQDIVTTYKLDGVAANVINTPYVQKKGTQINWLERQLFRSRKLRPVLFAFRTMRSVGVLAEAIKKPTWKELWGAGQVVGIIDDVAPIKDIIENIVREYEEAVKMMPNVS